MRHLSAITYSLAAALGRVPRAERPAAEAKLRDRVGNAPELAAAKALLAAQEAAEQPRPNPTHHRRRWRDAPDQPA